MLAFCSKPKNPITPLIREIRGSSSVVMDTLRKVLARHEAKQSPDLRMADDIDDVEVISQEIDDPEWGGGEAIDPVPLATEISHIASTIALARRIGSNENGTVMLRALPQILDEIERKGGQRNAVIFAESVRTQRYRADLLTEAGYGVELR